LETSSIQAHHVDPKNDCEKHVHFTILRGRGHFFTKNIKHRNNIVLFACITFGTLIEIHCNLHNYSDFLESTRSHQNGYYIVLMI